MRFRSLPSLVRTVELALLLLLALLVASSRPIFPVGATQRAKAVVTTPITHVIVIMEENHTFDNLFGTFPGANGIIETQAPNPLSGDIDHEGPNAIAAIDGGKMDNFNQRGMVE